MTKAEKPDTDARIADLMSRALLEVQTVKRTGDGIERSVEALKLELAGIEDEELQKLVLSLVKSVHVSQRDVVGLERAFARLAGYVESAYGISGAPGGRGPSG